MLIVIVIIGILATALIPKLIGIRQRAKNTSTVTIARQIQTAMGLYYHDHGYYPEVPGSVCLGDYGPDDSCSIGAISSTTTIYGHVNMQNMIRSYMSADLPHYSVLNADSNHVQDAFLYNCVSIGGPHRDCNEGYFMAFSLAGIGADCGGLRGLNDTSQGLPITLTTNRQSNNSYHGFTYCLGVIRGDEPGNYSP